MARKETKEFERRWKAGVEAELPGSEVQVSHYDHESKLRLTVQYEGKHYPIYHEANELWVLDLKDADVERLIREVAEGVREGRYPPA